MTGMVGPGGSSRGCVTAPADWIGQCREETIPYWMEHVGVGQYWWIPCWGGEAPQGWGQKAMLGKW